MLPAPIRSYQLALDTLLPLARPHSNGSTLPWATSNRPFAGTNRTINTMDVSRHLAELEYRFSSTGDTISPPLSPRLPWASARTTTMPYRLLNLAEIHA
jgi:hypothetical protein